MPFVKKCSECGGDMFAKPCPVDAPSLKFECEHCGKLEIVLTTKSKLDMIAYILGETRIHEDGRLLIVKLICEGADVKKLQKAVDEIVRATHIHDFIMDLGRQKELKKEKIPFTKRRPQSFKCISERHENKWGRERF